MMPGKGETDMEDERLRLCHYDKQWNTLQLEEDERRRKEVKMRRERED